MKMKRIIPTIALLFTFSFTQPCLADLSVQSIGDYKVTIETLQNDYVKIVKQHVVQKGNELVVSGRVKRTSKTGSLPGAHIDATLFDAEGNPISKTTTSYHPGIIPRKGAKESRFSVRLPLIMAPQNYKIILKFHNSDQIS